LESIRKILNLEPLNRDDLNELQTTFNALKGAEEEEDRELKDSKNLIIFIRKIGVELDRSVIDRKCAEFLNENDFNEEQRRFIDLVIDYAIRNGNVTGADLANRQPFCDYQITDIFDADVTPLLQLIDLFNDALNVAA